ncbi:FAD-dependent oxidoreductase [Pelobium sp.]|nr:FAD-dependent oxidoreductase [Pelobium sp.]MDA9554800.1 FAD-dependent oxidoreductase [Pelobium sp.]
MIKKFLGIILLILSIKAQAQYKPDVIVIGGTAAGTAAAIQAAKSGVKTLLINPKAILVGENAPDMSIPAFDTGFWKVWKDSYQRKADSTSADPRMVLSEIVKNTKDLQYLSETNITAITERKGGWEIKLPINGKIEEIKCKVLVDATADIKLSPVVKFKLLPVDDNGKFVSLVSDDQKQQSMPYNQLQKLYRTSGAAGFGKDCLTLRYIPLGAFIPQQKENLLVVSMAAFKNYQSDDFKNIALWTNMGQAVGALAAYGPFFDTTPSKANVRLTQGEMFTYKSFLYPVTDIKTTDLAWYPIQKIIGSGILKLDFKTGHFNPDSTVKAQDVKSILTELYPRTRIWFIENKLVSDLALKDFISMISFTTGRDPISIKKEVEANWKNKYKFSSDFAEDKIINKREMAVLLDAYLSPFNIRVDFNGYFLR